ncbi:MAG: IclR family transcriptional regulator C-terminal domain-containing protein [Pseudomonadota bacterium]
MNVLPTPEIILPEAEAEDAPRRAERVGSFGKGLMVIRALSEATRGMTLSEVSEATGTTRASARRYLLTLIELGYAEQIDKRFELTPRILELGGPRYESGLTWQIAQPHMEALARRLGESCTAAIRDGTDVVCTAHVEAERLLAFRLPVGARLPALSTALGRVILAEISDDCLRDVIRQAPPARHTHFSLQEPEALLAEAARIRQAGYALVDQELELGLRSIAVPIRNARGRVFAGLGISAECARVEMRAMCEDYLRPLRETAEIISRLNRLA